MKDFGEIPGGQNKLRPLLYPFYTLYPLKFWSKFRWWRNSKINHLLPSLNKRKKWLTVIDRLGAPGDALITANVIRCIKNKFNDIRINCITPNAQLIQFDPNIDTINQAETFFSFDSSYWELIVRKEKDDNIIAHNLRRLGIVEYEYRSLFYLDKEEENWATNKIGKITKPLIAVCTKSKESVKNWVYENWVELIQSLKTKFTILHIGDDQEPIFQDVIRFAGKLTMRESAAILSRANLFIGPDSLLMHVANGLGISSVIIFGGSRPVSCFGYSQNINLATNPECSPCWIHKGYENCSENLKCLHEISVTEVLSSVNRLLNTSK